MQSLASGAVACSAWCLARRIGLTVLGNFHRRACQGDKIGVVWIQKGGVVRRGCIYRIKRSDLGEGAKWVVIHCRVASSAKT